MLDVWLEAKDKSKLILRLILRLRNYNTEVESRDRNKKSGSLDHYVTIALHLGLINSIFYL